MGYSTECYYCRLWNLKLVAVTCECSSYTSIHCVIPWGCDQTTLDLSLVLIYILPVAGRFHDLHVGVSSSWPALPADMDYECGYYTESVGILVWTLICNIHGQAVIIYKTHVYTDGDLRGAINFCEVEVFGTFGEGKFI